MIGKSCIAIQIIIVKSDLIFVKYEDITLATCAEE